MVRARGEGTTYKTADNRWVSEVTVGWKPDGRGGVKRDRRRVVGHSQEDASQKRLQLLSQKLSGLPIPDGKLTVDAWMRHWLHNICPNRVRASTLRTYESYCRLWIAPGIGAVKLRDLRAEHLDALYAHMASAGRAAASQLQVHRIITRSLQVALQREHVARNVGHMVDPPSGPAKEAVWFTAKQVKGLLGFAEHDTHHVRWVVAIALGLRQGEALGLTWGDVDLKASTLHVRQQLVRVPGEGVDFGPLKTKASNRILPLPATVRQMLREHRMQQLEHRLSGNEWEPWKAQEVVFCQPNGRPVDHARDYRNWCALLKAAGLPRAPLHSARHTTATLLLMKGVALPVVADYLGHGSTRMTERYAHVVPALTVAAAAQMEKVMWG